MVDRILTYGRFIKIEHTLFSFPLLLSGALLARNHPLTLRTFVLILLAGTGARMAALALNRILDRSMDRENPRTAGRELPQGAIGVDEAWLVTLIGTIIYLVAAYLISPRCLLLAPLPLAVFVVYPLLKRFTMWSHLGVGLGLSMAPLGAWYAVSLTFGQMFPALILALFTFFWVSGFDIIYATLDEEHDRKAGLRSLPACLGRPKALSVSMGLHVAAFLCLSFLYWREFEGVVAALFLLVAGGLLYLEHRKAEDVELAFFKVNAALGFIVLAFVFSGLHPTPS
ncbi:MAG: 4-hydroxybenzoate octaprenyltransferase [Acidobacteriota bacterium]